MRQTANALAQGARRDMFFIRAKPADQASTVSGAFGWWGKRPALVENAALRRTENRRKRPINFDGKDRLCAHSCRCRDRPGMAASGRFAPFATASTNDGVDGAPNG